MHASSAAASVHHRLKEVRGPLAESYWGAVALVLLALVPYLALTTALQPMEMLIGKDTGLSMRSLQLTTGMANAAYSFGALLAVQLASRLPGRRLLVLYASLFLIGTAMAAWAPVAGFFVAGHVLQGFATGLMLIGAVPPLVIGYGPERLRSTAVVMNLGLFGATAIGPVIGGSAAGAMDWRVTFWIVAGIGLLAVIFTLLTYEDEEPADPDVPWDIVPLALGAAGTGALFFGVSELQGRHAYDLLVLGPVLAGAAMIVALLVHQYVADDPLVPVKRLAHTLPTAAIVSAMAAGAASVALVELAQMALMMKGASPNHAGMLFWTEFGAALLAAITFGRLIFTALTPFLAFAGLLVLGGGGAVLTGATRGSDALVVVGAGMVGFGVGSSVAPAMFTAGFSLRSPELPRVFAVVELLRGVAAFLVGPALIQLALAASPQPAVGLRTGTWVGTGIALSGAVLAAAIYLLGRARPQRPAVEAWLAGDQPAIVSTRLGEAVRPNAGDTRMQGTP